MLWAGRFAVLSKEGKERRVAYREFRSSSESAYPVGEAASAAALPEGQGRGAYQRPREGERKMWSLQQGAEDGRTAGRQNAAAVRQSLHQSFRSLVASPSGETRLFVEYVERMRADLRSTAHTSVHACVLTTQENGLLTITSSSRPVSIWESRYSASDPVALGAVDQLRVGRNNSPKSSSEVLRR